MATLPVRGGVSVWIVFVENDLQCSVAGSHDGYCRGAEMMKEDPL